MTGDWRESGFACETKVRSFHGPAWLPFPEMKNGGLANPLATAEKAARSSAVPGSQNQATVAVAAAASHTLNRRWSLPVTVEKSADRPEHGRERGF